MRTLRSVWTLIVLSCAVAGAAPALAGVPAQGDATPPAAVAASDSTVLPASERLARPVFALAAGTGEKADAKKDAGAGQSGPLIDINTATEEELASLPGIGEARSKAIVKGRPYARKDELVRRKIIPQSVYDQIRERIIAKQR